jgi:8-oxo-dGTP diphosphatase
MKSPDKTRPPVQAAGGIVVREAPNPLIAIVRLRKDKTWVLPKGKLKAGEDALAAAVREVTEETGHDVSVHEFLGTMPNGGAARPKITQFWRMRADGKPARKLMRDVKAVKWLPLEQAIEKLTHAHERAFLGEVGPVALRAAGHASREARSDTLISRVRTWLGRLTQRRAH